MSFLTAMVLLGLTGATPVDSPVVPIELQVELLAKVLRYDRTFSARVGDEVRVLVVHAADAPESTRVGQELVAALRAMPRLGGVAHRETLHAFTTEAALAAVVKEQRIAVVVFAPGFAGKAARLKAVFDGCDCLTVGSTPDGIREGLVLGLDLVSGKPHMLFNLGQSRRQGLDFRAELLQLMTVFP